MRGDCPVLPDDALERDEVFVFLFTGRVRGHVDVAAVVVKHGLPRGGRQAVTRRIVKRERVSDLRRALSLTLVDVDPQELRAVQSSWTGAKIVQMLNLVAVKEDRFAQPDVTLRSRTPDGAG
jgi:hypothetical protein